jgi:hypothetical protein
LSKDHKFLPFIYNKILTISRIHTFKGQKFSLNTFVFMDLEGFFKRYFITMKKILCMLLVTCFFNYSTINSQTPFPEFFTDARAGNASERGEMTLQTGGAGKGAEGVAATFLSSQVNSKESAPLLGNAPFSGLASMVASNTAHNSAPGFFSQSRTSLNSQKIASISSLNFGAGVDMKSEEPDSSSNSNQKGGILTDKRYAAVSQSPQMLDLTQSDEPLGNPVLETLSNPSPVASQSSNFSSVELDERADFLREFFLLVSRDSDSDESVEPSGGSVLLSSPDSDATPERSRSPSVSSVSMQSDEPDDFFEDALFPQTLVSDTPPEASTHQAQFYETRDALDLPVHFVENKLGSPNLAVENSGDDYENIDEWGVDLLDGRVSPANSGADLLLFEDASSPEFEFDRNSNDSLSYCDSDHELGILDDEYETEDEEGSSSPLFGVSSSPGADLTTFADLSAEERAAVQQALRTLNKKETASWGADYDINSDDEPLSPVRSRRSSVSRSQPDDTYFL